MTAAENLESTHAWLTEQRIEFGFSRVGPQTLARLDQLGLLEGASLYTTNRQVLAQDGFPSP